MALGVTAIMLSGCGGGRSPLQGPIVDMAGVDMNRYNHDLSECTRLKQEATFVGNGQYISICMEKRGYRIIERMG